MPEMRIKEKGFKNVGKLEKKILGYDYSTVGLDYPCYEKIVGSSFESPGLLEYIPESRRQESKKIFSISWNQAVCR